MKLRNLLPSINQTDFSLVLLVLEVIIVLLISALFPISLNINSLPSKKKKAMLKGPIELRITIFNGEIPLDLKTFKLPSS